MLREKSSRSTRSKRSSPQLGGRNATRRRLFASPFAVESESSVTGSDTLARKPARYTSVLTKSAEGNDGLYGAKRASRIRREGTPKRECLKGGLYP